MRQDGSDVKMRIVRNGIESAAGELTYAGKTIATMDKLGGGTGQTINGDLSFFNVWGPSILLAVSDILDVYNEELLP